MPIESTLIDTLYVFLMTILPYIALATLFSGLIYRGTNWLRSRQKSQFVTPKKSSSTPTKIANFIKGMILEVFFLRKVYRGSFKLWLISWPTHMAILGMFFGHLRLFAELTPIWELFNMTEQEIESFSALSGLIVGTIFVAGFALLLVRRTVIKEVREISTLDDYLILVLILSAGLFGMGMRLIPEGHIILSEFRTYFVNSLTLNPTPIPPFNPYFTLHALFNYTLLIYLPFSKLVHIFTVPITETIKDVF
ncbi:MAG: respiratory nitrate reductase subunit gamma [archaeon]|nr:respiratory nitrate reductase subunit gamma [archaeon]MCP8306802.1 respiratory nitrate reductase subunit gamma [archaeon]